MARDDDDIDTLLHPSLLKTSKETLHCLVHVTQGNINLYSAVSACTVHAHWVQLTQGTMSQYYTMISMHVLQYMSVASASPHLRSLQATPTY